MRWIVGDIHGCARPLDQLIRAVTAADAQAFFFFVGDYINRGPDSKGVVDRLLHLPNARFCRGNHDNVLDLLLHNVCYDVRPDRMHPHAEFVQFLDAGLDRTLISYGVDMAEVYDVAVKFTDNRLHKLLEVVPREHRVFFRRLEPIIEHEDLFITHARWPVDLKDGPELLIDLCESSCRLRQEVIWGRYKRVEIDAPKAWRRRGFFGHTPVSFYDRDVDAPLPIVGNRMVLLDTAIALGVDGRLTAYCADTDRYIQVDRQLETIELAAEATAH